MKKLLLTVLIPITLLGQWKYESGGNQFDGKFKAAYVAGKGFEFPYNKPLLAINRFDEGKVNFYISNIGFLGCDNNELIFSFKGEDKLYHLYNPSTNNSKDALFIEAIDGISLSSFLKKLKEMSMLYVRHKSDCQKRDFEFTLSGSSKAIDFAIGDWLVDMDKKYDQLSELEDKFLSYYEELSCDDQLDTDKVYFEKTIYRETDLVHAKDGNMYLKYGTKLKFSNSPYKRYTIKMVADLNGSVNEHFIEPETAIILGANKDIISLMNSGLILYHAKREQCR